jgi:hypothetical protein
MALDVIGAGFGRTGTLSLKLALERLRYGPCYHMEEIIRDPAKIDDWMNVTRSSPPNWDGVFDGYRTCVDWPAATYWRDLAAYYPEAKIILSVRDPEDWFESTQKTIFNAEMVATLPPPMREMIDLTVFSLFDGQINDRSRCIEVYQRHFEAVINSPRPERLLLFRASDGWGPLCDFLGCPVPVEPYPRTNDADEFRRVAGKISSLAATPVHETK